MAASDLPDLSIAFTSKPQESLGSDAIQGFSVRLVNSGANSISNLELTARHGIIEYEKSSQHLAQRRKPLSDLDKNTLIPQEEWVVDFKAANITKLTQVQVQEATEGPLELLADFSYQGGKWKDRWFVEMTLEVRIGGKWVFQHGGPTPAIAAGGSPPEPPDEGPKPSGNDKNWEGSFFFWLKRIGILAAPFLVGAYLFFVKHWTWSSFPWLGGNLHPPEQNLTQPPPPIMIKSTAHPPSTKNQAFQKNHSGTNLNVNGNVGNITVSNSGDTSNRPAEKLKVELSVKHNQSHDHVVVSKPWDDLVVDIYNIGDVEWFSKEARLMCDGRVIGRIDHDSGFEYAARPGEARYNVISRFNDPKAPERYIDWATDLPPENWAI